MEEKCIVDKTSSNIDKATIQPSKDLEAASTNLTKSTDDDKASKREPSWVHVWPQILASCISLSITIQPGISLAFSSILIPQLTKDPNIKNFTKVEASWIASVVAIGTPIGALFAGPLMDSLGRKKVCILTNVPIILSWILTYTTKESVQQLYIARSLAGIGGGMTTVALVYTAEISHVGFRPMLLCLNSVFVAFGVMAATVLGAYIEWHQLALLFGMLGIVSFSLCLILPESPYWLINFKTSEARTSLALEELQKLNRPDWLYQQESKRLKEALHIKTTSKPESNEKKSFLIGIRTTIKEYSKRSVVAPFALLLIMFLLQQLSGVYVIIFYSVNIFKGVGGKFSQGFNEFTGAILLGVLRFVMSLLTAGLSRRYGRRPLMITSSIGMAASCLVAGFLLTVTKPPSTSFISKETNASSNLTLVLEPAESSESNLLSIITLTALLVFVCAGAVGHLVIPWTLISELLPTKARAIGSGVVISYAYVLMFSTVKSFPFLLDFFQLYIIFYFYSVISLISALFTYVFLPETLGKSFTEIAKFFEKKDNR